MAQSLVPPLVVICGPTASGKTSLAVRLAQEYNGEIISADSRAIYKYLDIGTAKPLTKERGGVVHWGIDLIEPDQAYSAADFKMYAIEKITDIRARGKTPFLVGGTGLYIDSVLYDYQFPPPVPREIRQQYDTWSLETLQHYCDDNNIDLPENSQNKRYIINAIVRAGQKLEKRTLPIENTIVVGIATDKITLRQRIEQRAEAIITPAVMDEARRVADDYGWDNEAMTGNIYPLLRRHLADELSFSDMKQAFVTLDWRLAKRQLTWLRRNEHIVWLGLDEAYTYCARALAKLNNS